MSVSLVKGQKVDITKGNPGLKKVLVGLGWNPNKYDGGHEFDLDASAFLTSNGKVRNDSDFVFYNASKHPSGSVISTGDNRNGEGQGDDEQLVVDLSLVPLDVDKISFVITIHESETRNQNFGMVSDSYVRIVDEVTGKEMFKYDLGEDFSVETAIVAGELYRHNGEWKFLANGSGFAGGLAAIGKDFGVNIS